MPVVRRRCLHVVRRRPYAVSPAVVAAEAGVDLGTGGQAPPQHENSAGGLGVSACTGDHLAGQSPLGADADQRFLRDPDRARPRALQQDPLRVAGQHSLRPITEITGRHPFQPVGRQRASHVEPTRGCDDGRADQIRHPRQRADQFGLPLGPSPPATQHPTDRHADENHDDEAEDVGRDGGAGVHVPTTRFIPGSPGRRGR